MSRSDCEQISNLKNKIENYKNKKNFLNDEINIFLATYSYGLLDCMMTMDKNVADWL